MENVTSIFLINWLSLYFTTVFIMYNFIFLQKSYAGKYGNGKFPTKNMQKP